MKTPTKQYWEIAKAKQFELMPRLKKALLKQANGCSLDPLTLSKVFETGNLSTRPTLEEYLAEYAPNFSDDDYFYEYINFVLMTLAFVPVDDIDPSGQVLYKLITDAQKIDKERLSMLLLKIEMSDSLSRRFAKEFTLQWNEVGDNNSNISMLRHIIMNNSQPVMKALLEETPSIGENWSSSWSFLISASIRNPDIGMIELIMDAFRSSRGIEGKGISSITEVFPTDEERVQLFLKAISFGSGSANLSSKSAIWVCENLPFKGEKLQDAWDTVIGTLNNRAGGGVLEYSTKNALLPSLSKLGEVDWEIAYKLKTPVLKTILDMKGNAWKKALLNLDASKQYLLPAIVREYTKRSPQGIMDLINVVPEWQKPSLIVMMSNELT